MDAAALFGNLPVLETERLLLRPLAAGDAEAIFAYASDPEVARWTTWEAHDTVEASRGFLAMCLDAYAGGEHGPWALIAKDEGRLCGTVGFTYWRQPHRRAELGYALARRLWGRGLMTEAVREMLRFGFAEMGCNRIEARCVPENIGSARVMEKVGMTFEGVLREQMFVKGSFVSLRLYSVLRREWQQHG